MDRTIGTGLSSFLLALALLAMVAVLELVMARGSSEARTSAPAVVQQETPTLTATVTATVTPIGADIEAVSLTHEFLSESGNTWQTSSALYRVTEIVRNNGPHPFTSAFTDWGCGAPGSVPHRADCRWQAQPGDTCFRGGTQVPCDDPGVINGLRFVVDLPEGQPVTIVRNVTLTCPGPGFGFGEAFFAGITASHTTTFQPDPNPNNNFLQTDPTMSVLCEGDPPTPTATGTPTSPTPTPTSTPTLTPTATATATPTPPDLVVESISDAQDPLDCSSPVGVHVVVRNIGTTGAGPSTTRVSAANSGDSELVATPPLGAGQSVTLFASVFGIPSGDTYTAVADFLGNVQESNEGNNTGSASFSQRSLPTCTPTPTATGTPTATATPTCQPGLCTPTPTSTPCPPQGCPPPPTACPTSTPTATPTSTPTPPPAPSPTTTPPATTTSFVICNDTGQPVTDLHVMVNGYEAVSLTNAPGCPAPAQFGNSPSGPRTQLDLVWPTACVDPFETVRVSLSCPPGGFIGCSTPPQLECFHWTRSGTLLPSADPCQTLRQPVPFASFPNGNTESANDLHFRVTNVGVPIQVLLDNAPGCANPAITTAGFDPVLVDVVWSAACVDTNEFVSVAFFSSTCTGGPHPCLSPRVDCFNYTLDGALLDSPDTCGTPTPTPTATPCAPEGCPTSTPTATATATSTPTTTPTATATPPPGLHDGRAKKISAGSSVVLSDGTADTKTIVVQVRNEGDHTESFAAYLDIVAPGGSNGSNPNGCTPHGRIIDTVVTLAPGEQTVVETTQTFNCANVSGALGQTYTLMGAVDVHADDGGACGPFQLQTMTCFNALADDDNDDADNRVTTNAFRVK